MFKAGDKVYSIRHGIVTLVEVEGEHSSDFPIGIETLRGIEGHTAEGKCLIIDKQPSIITLEKAEKMGLVRKKVMYGEKLQVKYFDIDWERYCFSCFYYECESDFRRISEPEWKFISFVDEKLNECNPPQETIEWEEIV